MQVIFQRWPAYFVSAKSGVWLQCTLGKASATDWINMRYSYTTTYNWIGASQLARELGNIVENSQQNAFNTEFDFTRLYSKSKMAWQSNAAKDQGWCWGQQRQQQSWSEQANDTTIVQAAFRGSKGLSGSKRKMHCVNGKKKTPCT